MYEPTEREISLEICRALNRIDQKLNWILAAAVCVVLAIAFR